MSTLTDTAELEAAIAEAELTDEEGELVKRLVVEEQLAPDEAIAAAIATRDEQPQPPAPPAGEPEGEEPSSKQLRELVKENERHVAAVSKIMGGFVDGFEPCEKCDTLGLQPPGPKPRTHSFFKACETCAGFGQVLTGSLEAQYQAVACPDCGGRGYLEAMVDNTPAVEVVKQLREQRAAAPRPLEPVALAPVVEPAGGEVTFGRPSWMGDPGLGA